VFSVYLIPTIIVATIGLFLFDPFIGLFHFVGTDLLGLWEGAAFSHTELAMPIVILVGSWKFAIFVTIFVLAQLQGIPSTFYETARICGANSWEMFRDITLPRIKGALLVVILLRAIFMFNKFDIIWILTEGGPGQRTTTLPVLAYRETFVQNAYGLGNAIAIVMFVFLAIGGILYFRMFSPSEEVEA
jgi:multiple sugar transport system permease protein